MNLILRINIYLLSFLVTKHFVNAENNGYTVTKIGIPHAIWKQALHPVPILKSPATIVVPIHVDGDIEDSNEIYDDDEETVTESVVVDETLVNDDAVETVPEVTVPPAADVPQNPVDGEVLPPQQDVPGQVIRFPCSCLSGQCGCCTGAVLERFNMKACGNMTFVPEDFVFDVRLSVNNNTVVRRRVSASDPPPICFNPRRAPFVRVCVELSNIRVRNRNAHACLDINADIAGFPIFTRSFRCFSFGSSGIKTGLKPKPVSSGPKPVNLFGNAAQEEGGFIQNAAEAVLGGGGEGGLFGGGDGNGIFGAGDGGGEGIFGGGGDEGPLDAIGDALGNILDGRSFE